MATAVQRVVAGGSGSGARARRIIVLLFVLCGCVATCVMLAVNRSLASGAPYQR